MRSWRTFRWLHDVRLTVRSCESHVTSWWGSQVKILWPHRVRLTVRACESHVTSWWGSQVKFLWPHRVRLTVRSCESHVTSWWGWQAKFLWPHSVLRLTVRSCESHVTSWWGWQAKFLWPHRVRLTVRWMLAWSLLWLGVLSCWIWHIEKLLCTSVYTLIQILINNKLYYTPMVDSTKKW